MVLSVLCRFFTHRNHQYLHVHDLIFASVCIICDWHHLVRGVGGGGVGGGGGGGGGWGGGGGGGGGGGVGGGVGALLYSTEFEAFCRWDVNICGW